MARTYVSGIPISLNAMLLIFPAKITPRLERLSRDKNSSLVGSNKSYEEFFCETSSRDCIHNTSFSFKWVQ
jgi:hypothetical protein